MNTGLGIQIAYIEAPSIPVGMTVSEYRRSRAERRHRTRRATVRLRRR